MSDYSICHQNSQSGNCDCECELFLSGECEAGGDIAEDLFSQLTQDEIDVELTYRFEGVKLFTLRGAGKSDLELFIESLGY